MFLLELSRLAKRYRFAAQGITRPSGPQRFRSFTQQSFAPQVEVEGRDQERC